MNNVNKTLYISLYGKAYVSKKHIILHDKKAELIWEKEGFELKGKSKSKWLAYYMAMRSAFYDEWAEKEIRKNPEAIVLHIGCGLDSRIERISAKCKCWFDIDFPEVIEERRKYFEVADGYQMLAADMRLDYWKDSVEAGKDAIVIMEGVSMYFEPEQLYTLLKNLSGHFSSVNILMDCYTEKSAKASKYKNPINDVGVTHVYGYDNPQKLANRAGFAFKKEYDMTPKKYINELEGIEKSVFKYLFAGKIAKSMYRIYEFHK